MMLCSSQQCITAKPCTQHTEPPHCQRSMPLGRGHSSFLLGQPCSTAMPRRAAGLALAWRDLPEPSTTTGFLLFLLASAHVLQPDTIFIKLTSRFRAKEKKKLKKKLSKIYFFFLSLVPSCGQVCISDLDKKKQMISEGSSIESA